MRKIYFLFFVSIIITAIGCKSKDKPAGKSENYADAARNFIRAALDGKFSEASSFMLQDSINLNWLEVAERSYEKADQSIKNGYRASSIRIHQPILNVNDSTSIVIFSNSYKNDPDTLKVNRVNGNWLVDLKYLYEHGSDTLTSPSLTASRVDSILERAKNLSAIIFDNVEKVDEKMMTKEQLKELCDPMQKELDSLTKELSFSQYEELKVYRTKLVSEMVDRKVERDRKNK